MAMVSPVDSSMSSGGEAYGECCSRLSMNVKPPRVLSRCFIATSIRLDSFITPEGLNPFTLMGLDTGTLSSRTVIHLQ